MIAGVPADDGTTKPCLVDVVRPTAPSITDVCGRTITPVFVDSVADLHIDGTGTVTFHFKYTDCAHHDSIWTYTDTLVPGLFTPVKDSLKYVACLSNVVTPQTPVFTVCGDTVKVLYDSVHTATMSCDTAIYHYHYTVNGTKYTWKYTYVVKPSMFSLPSDSLVKVQCIADATTPTPPVVTNSCGTLVQSVLTAKDSVFDGCEGTVTYHFTYNDCTNEHAAVWKLVYKIKDTIKPAFTVPADYTICRQIDNSYNAATSLTGVPTALSDNCLDADSLKVTYTDVVTTHITVQDTLTRTWKVADKCNDSVQVQRIFINPSYNLTVKDTICQLAGTNTWTWRDTTFAAGTVSGDYVFHRTSINGCDSIVTLQLTVKDTVKLMVTESIQDICLASAIEAVPIAYSHATISVLPDLSANGLTLTSHNNGKDTISGIPTAAGSYTYLLYIQ